MQTSLITTIVLMATLAGAVPGTKAASIFESDAELTPGSEIDKLVLDRLQQLGIQPARVCSDEVFVRRVYLDVIGTLPTSDEAREFLKDQDPQKRRALIDRLLEREEFADYWAMKWGDLLRVKAEFPINLWPNAVQAYHRWIRTSIKENVPYDRVVREMLTANGSNFRVGQVNFYRAMQNKTPEGVAEAVALSFMGVRADKWPKDKLAGLAAFFSKNRYKPTTEWKEEIVFFDPRKAADEPGVIGRESLTPEGQPTPTAAAKPMPGPIEAVFPDGERVTIPPEQDPRVVFADWLITAENPWFARNLVNLAWSWLLGRGIIHEPDDIRPDNPPANPELLSYLEKEFTAHKYDLKHLLRLILNSQTYQLSSVAKSASPEARAHFASYPLRRLEAEVLIDALNQITGTTESYSSAVPEPFTYVPEEYRSIALPDASITSSFLEMFGRPSRSTGLESERSLKPTADQMLHLLNSSHIEKKISTSPELRALFKSADPASKAAREEVVKRLYLRILSRFPSEQERETVTGYLSSESARNGMVDLVWALINTEEFLYRH